MGMAQAVSLKLISNNYDTLTITNNYSIDSGGCGYIMEESIREKFRHR